VALDFSFTREQEEFRTFVREFARKEILPYAAQWDEKEEMPWPAIRRMGEAGLLGIIAPKRLGGQEKDYIALGIAVEEVARVDNSCAMILSMQNTLSTLIPGWGDDTVRAVLRGEKLLCIATSETEAGSDVSNMATTARLEDGQFVINGQKIHVSLMPGAAVMGVTARVTQGDGKGRIYFLRVPSDAPGVSTELMPEMGLRSHQLAIVNFKDVRIPVGDVLGGKGEGKAVLYARWNVSRCLSALNALGAAQQVLEDTIDFVRRKQVYGRPIGQYQAISFPLVEHSTRVEGCRLLAYKGLWMNNRGENAARVAGMAKWSSISFSIQAIHDCLQMYGAAGYLKDMPVERRYRDVLGLTFTGGTINVMKLIVVKELLGAEFMGISGAGEG
jgi:alkylation response protein AidB-like acyl-CoA dehydrogenase